MGLDYDSDLEEIDEDGSDSEYHSADDAVDKSSLKYDLDKMFEIVYKRDYRNWNLKTVHKFYRKITDGPYGRVQMHRMRKFVKRGGVSTKVQYEKLRDKVWQEVRQLDCQSHVIHDRDVQEIAMIVARELGIPSFRVEILIICYCFVQSN